MRRRRRCWPATDFRTSASRTCRPSSRSSSITRMSRRSLRDRRRPSRRDRRMRSSGDQEHRQPVHDVDARTTIVDQSTNQNIWTNGGDVTQIFDQEAVVASGDSAVAAGDDATFVDSEVDVTVGDVAIGNTTNDGSYNTTVGDDSVVEDVAVEGADAMAAAEPARGRRMPQQRSALRWRLQSMPRSTRPQSSRQRRRGARPEPVPVSEPVADPLASDMTASRRLVRGRRLGSVVDEERHRRAGRGAVTTGT